MDFILRQSKSEADPNYRDWQKHILAHDFELLIKGDRYRVIKGQGHTTYVVGDCVNPEELVRDNKKPIEELLFRLKGNFYLIRSEKNEITLANSLFSLLPIYYTLKKDFFSSSLSTTAESLLREEPLERDPKFLINQLLFHYQFGNTTPYTGVKLFPSFHYCRLTNDRADFVKYLQVHDLFVKKPTSWQNSIDDISEEFIIQADKYITDKGSVVSFTGGFDGRTLVSIGTHFKKDFETFSYGKMEFDDVHIPLANTKELDIPYNWLDLGREEYTHKSYFTSAASYTKNTNYQNGLLYAHVDYSAKHYKGKTLISGVCGSELLRTTHSPGAVTSQALINLFQAEEKSVFAEAVHSCDALRYLKKDKYINGIKEVINEAWDYRASLLPGLSQNQQLYVFIFEEVFRKFFGAWVSSQMNYVSLRTPYLDFDFFKALMQTELSGAYGDFLTKNPLKRFKGQLLYAEIIKKTNDKIYRQVTGKGYAPKHVREALQRTKLILPFIAKRLRRRLTDTNLDNLGILSGVASSATSILDGFDSEFLVLDLLKRDIENIKETTNERRRDTILQTLSYIQFFDEIGWKGE